MKQPELYERFLALHKREGGFIMPNPWDGLSALLLKQAGYRTGTAASPSEAPVQARRRDSPGEISVPERRNQGLLGAAKQTCPLYRNTVPLVKSTSPMAFISPVAPANLPVPAVRCRG